jgi:hypothetical protein
MAVSTDVAEAGGVQRMEEPLVNCVMLCTWPERSEMIQQAIESFVRQTHRRKLLTIVNDGEPCALSVDFLQAHAGAAVVSAPRGSSIGHKRNIGARAATHADYIAPWDDDDLSLPTRLSTHIERIGSDGVWHRFNRWFVALGALDAIVGFEWASGYGASLIRTDVCLNLGWPDKSWLEDHALFERLRASAEYAPKLRESNELLYVHRRHEANASAPHRKDLRQGLLPLQLAGADVTAALAAVLEISAAGAARAHLAAGPLQVGQRVRARLGALAARGTIATLDAEHAELLMDKDGRELRVPIAALSCLEPFELCARRRPPAPAALKDAANALFKLDDCDAALELYAEARALLSAVSLTSGSRVLVKPPPNARGGRMRPATIATLDDGGGGTQLADVLYDDEPLHATEPEEELLPRERLVAVGADAPLQVALYLNCARAAAKRGDRLEPIGWAERALACAAHVEPAAQGQALALKALYLLARAELARSNFKGAEAAAARGAALAGADEREWRALAAEVARRKAEHLRQNKRLAKEVSSWISGVMDADGDGGQPSERATDATGASAAAARPLGDDNCATPGEARARRNRQRTITLATALVVLCAALALARTVLVL